MQMNDQQSRTAAEWARHWDIICLGTLTIATAITGTAVVLATGSDLPAAVAAGNLSRTTLAWVLFGMGALLLYLASTVIAGVTIHLFTGNRNRHPALKQLGIATVHGLLALEAVALAVMLAMESSRPGPPAPPKWTRHQGPARAVAQPSKARPQTSPPPT